LKRILREPLVHFLLLGALLFLWSAWQGGGAAGSNRIVITPGVVEYLAAGFHRTWGRVPNELELKGLIDEHVKEEIAAREALAMGLERDDVVIKRRLRQKLEFLLVDDAAAEPPTDAELQAWLDRHPDAFRIEAQLAIRQVLLRPEQRGASVSADASKLLARLRATGAEAGTGGLGDASMLPAETPLEPLREVARTFGQDFADALMKLPPGQWSGPVESSFGLHLVFVRERTDGVPAELATVRPLVEREVLAERRKVQLQALYERLLAKYAVRIESPKALPAAADARGAP
jgi:parvulin-like peptidyl-prolyl isomerase